MWGGEAGMKYRLQENVSVSDTDYGSVILDGESGRYFQLNPVATEMLRMLGEGCTDNEVLDAIVDGYDVEQHRAYNDLRVLIEEALKADILAERKA